MMGRRESDEERAQEAEKKSASKQQIMHVPKSAKVEWLTAGGKRKHQQGKDVENKNKEKQEVNNSKIKKNEQKLSPRKKGNGSRNKNELRYGKGKSRDADCRDGRRVFAQLKRYLGSEVPAAYVVQTVVRLNELATSRRYQRFLAKHEGDSQGAETEMISRDQWLDLPEDKDAELYVDLNSYWDQSSEEHGQRLCSLLTEWITVETFHKRRLKQGCSSYTSRRIIRKKKQRRRTRRRSKPRTWEQ
ncbi:hypothetical protein V7S43_010503 [Phytophthora oleae]|uniref:Uncharacterized protein n=1 Tax=Phytophthora oleae TaxID=2107226 RepID=A0ABD3FEN3_9STRA